MVTLIQSRPGRPRPPNIHHPRVPPLPSWPRPHPSPLAVAIQSSRFIILPFRSCYKNGIIQYESFWDWLFSHSINSLEIHLVDLDFFFSSRMKSIYPSGHTIPNLNPYAGHRVTLFLGNFYPTDSQTDFRTVQMRLSFFREPVYQPERLSTGPIYFRLYIFTLIKLNVRGTVKLFSFPSLDTFQLHFLICLKSKNLKKNN